MVLNILALALVGGITFMHSTFGFFSGLVNLFCVVFGMVVAFGAYEAVTDAVTSSTHMSASYIGPCALMLLFFLTVLILRSIADALIRGNVVVAQWLDTSGAVFTGFVNAQITVGILMIAVLMLPLGSAPLGFQRLERTGGQDADNPDLPEVRRNSLWTRSDEMTVGLFNWVSDGSMQGGTAFRSVYPSFTDSVFFTGNTVQVESSPAATRDKLGDGFKGIEVIGVWPVEGKLENVMYRKEVPSSKKRTPKYEALSKGYTPVPGNKLIGSRIKLRKGAGDRTNRTSRHLFRPTMIRMVGDIGDQPKQYYARAIRNADDKLDKNDIRLVDFDNNFSLRDPEWTIEAYFEVDEGFEPRFIEYRRYARAAAQLPVEGEEVALGDLEAVKTEAEIRAARQQANRTFGSVANLSTEGSQLPISGSVSRQALTRAGVQLDASEIKNGRFSGDVDRFKGSDGGKVERLAIPDGQAMVQVVYTPKQAQTLAGEVFNFVGQLNQYYAVTDRGKKYQMVGYYGKVKRRGADYIELFYNGSPDDPGNPSYAGMLDFKDLNQSEVNDADDAEVGLIFLVPKGHTVVRVENQTGQGGEVNIPTRP